uniref:Uncharacterized protein n=1 Tax=Corethron hystrix TaxID=216773 RepID=A0A7S1FYV3_9STRA|mmetsp:Transcript_4125/g.7963  ORF Transcript_4125/g.7963 Transcript_4125/m.7963 type:complete len:372 (+) Transcript_4125:196-1311(+)
MLPRRSVYALIKRTHKLSRDSQLCNREVNFTFFRLKGSNSQHDCATQCRCNVVRSFSSDGEDNSKPPNPFEELIIPPRNAFEAIFSAFKGTKNLLQSQANRDKFVARANDQIIQPAALGIPTSIVLHHDLDNQLFEKYGFDEAEFIKGSKHALQAYYTVYSMIQNDMLRRESGGEEKNNTSLESSGNNTMKPPNETVANDGIDQEKVDARSPGSAENDKLKSKIDIDQRSDTSGLEQAVSDENSLESSKSENVPTSQPSWDAVADSDDQSLTYMLRKMVSPVQFKRLETEAKLMYSLSNLGEKAVFIDDSEVTNVSLTLLVSRSHCRKSMRIFCRIIENTIHNAFIATILFGIFFVHVAIFFFTIVKYRQF